MPFRPLGVLGFLTELLTEPSIPRGGSPGANPRPCYPVAGLGQYAEDAEQFALNLIAKLAGSVNLSTRYSAQASERQHAPARAHQHHIDCDPLDGGMYRTRRPLSASPQRLSHQRPWATNLLWNSVHSSALSAAPAQFSLRWEVRLTAR